MNATNSAAKDAYQALLRYAGLNRCAVEWSSLCGTHHISITSRNQVGVNLIPAANDTLGHIVLIVVDIRTVSRLFLDSFDDSEYALCTPQDKKTSADKVTWPKVEIHPVRFEEITIQGKDNVFVIIDTNGITYRLSRDKDDIARTKRALGLLPPP